MLLDFGIAKLLNPEVSTQTARTATALRVMTPECASPEQVRGETVTTASDVYSLGVLLYHLVTGRRPYRFKNLTPGEIERCICSEEPEKPSVAVGQVGEAAGGVGAAREGDRAAFGWLYVRYFGMVHGILLARVPRTDVRDLVQDVFLTALRKLAALRDPRAFGGWLAQIARNRANDYHRRNENPPQEELSKAQAPERGKTALQSAEALAALRAIQELPDAYRETLMLRFVEGMTGPEIAARTGLTAGSVRVNLHRGMKMLRERLTQGARP